MGKNKKAALPDEVHLVLPSHPERTPGSGPAIVDTHTHLVSTFSSYRSKYRSGKHETIHDFIRELYKDHSVEAIVDVWCEAPVRKVWREIADSALTEEDRERKWGRLEYWFVMGVHPHEAKLYTDEVEKEIVDAMSHPRCVGWGEIGLDFHYDNSPRDVQRSVFARQLQRAVGLGKPLTIHTREAEEDTERILKEHVPKDHKIHIHCYTDSPEWATRMLDHFPNLYIGITGVITYSTNLNTSAVIRNMARLPSPSLRILLETDAPFMTPSNLYGTLKNVRGKLPLSHSAMIPWTAEFVATVANGAEGAEQWDTERVMSEARENARRMYSV
ncbi:Deoxyribonuclease Tat-D [Sparassis crispa]|uniref:Deoxyribonuclease Tat-D n=1 Tax=Sparassis crispa TaxID=139825 RepID=A0A401GTE2_9APHY|nr:Deoxyribonuclease Tat-D [Sparassis crispa]GBE85492.1 Deoxyribonuclease Tat-D [Sparassis crispa]